MGVTFGGASAWGTHKLLPALFAVRRTRCVHHVTYDGAPLVEEKHATVFTSGEQGEVELTHVVPSIEEDEPPRLEATFEKPANWQPFSLVDGRLITGQNPAPSRSAAQALV